MTMIAGIRKKNQLRNNNKTERNYLFDNIKAFLIFSVVIAHYYKMSGSFAPGTFGGVVYTISFSYIMQGFLFVSGYFSKNPDRCRTAAFQTFLFPYLILMPVMYCVRYLNFGNANLDLTMPTMALWYLLTLFFYRYFLRNLIRIKNILPISIAVSLASGFIPFLDSSLSLGRTFSFLPFFLLGYYFKEEWIIWIKKVPKTYGVLTLAILVSICTFVAFSGIIPLAVLYMKAPYVSTGLSWPEGIVVRTLILLFAMAWIFVIVNLAPQRRTFLSLIGRNTMTVYVMHIIIRYILQYYGGFFGQDMMSYLVLSTFAAVTLWIFSRPAFAAGYQTAMDLLYERTIKNPFALSRRIV